MKLSRGTRIRIIVAVVFTAFWMVYVRFIYQLSSRGIDSVDPDEWGGLASGLVVIFAIDIWRWIQRGD